jgi:23S rRNA-/tRNA-specific pseudouridylate synthase
LPITGRRHQLRRHCAEVLGAPILGDDLHTGGPDVNITVRRQVGLYLYCRRVAVPHPIEDNKIVSAEIPEPRRFARHREKARKGWVYSNQNPVEVTK